MVKRPKVRLIFQRPKKVDDVVYLSDAQLDLIVRKTLFKPETIRDLKRVLRVIE